MFYYDADGQADSFVVYSGDTETCYYYVKNLQGDVTKIMSADGAVVANYCYDAYGKLLSTTNAEGVEITDTTSVAYLNPLRYRGYVYDQDTGLYYLQSRYYDPETCRFVNADVCVDTGTGVLGTNMFAYCNNNPINNIDSSGTDAYWLQATNAVVGAGHTSVLIRSGKYWWYCFWSADSRMIVKVDFNGNKTRLINKLKELHSYSWLFSGNYNVVKLIKGDFSKSFKKAFEIYNLKYKSKGVKDIGFNAYYDLIKNNCVTTSMRILLTGSFSSKSIKSAISYAYSKRNVNLFYIPNRAFNYMF